MQRSTPITIFGILNIVFAAFSIYAIAGTLGALDTLASPSVADSHNPAVKLMHDVPAYAALARYTIPVSLLSFVLLLSSGVGILRLSNLARKVAIGYGVYAVIIDVATTVATYIFVFRPLFGDGAHPHAAGAAGASNATVAAVAAGLMEGVFGLIYPIVLIFFMTRPEIVASFLPPPAPPALPTAEKD